MAAPTLNLQGMETGRKSSWSPKANDLINGAWGSLHKNPKGHGSESFRTAAHKEVPGGWWAQREYGHSVLLLPSISLPYPSLQRVFISILCDSLYNKPVNPSISLNSVSCLSKLIEPEEGEVGTLKYRENNLGPVIGLWSRDKALHRGLSSQAVSELTWIRGHPADVHCWRTTLSNKF